MSPAENKKNLFYLTLQYTGADGETYYDKIARCSVMGDDWVQLANTSYKIPDGAENMQLYVETGTGKYDFYIDDVVAASKGTVISGAGLKNAIIRGDINCDGRVDVYDVIAARKCYIDGFGEGKKYNIFYLMHGGGENENTIFSSDVKFNNMLDHMIQNGDIEPMMVVTPTFNGGCSAETMHRAYGTMVPQINAMKNMPVFTYTSDFSKGNFYFLDAPGLTHWLGYVRHYVYDALPYFFHE